MKSKTFFVVWVIYTFIVGALITGIGYFLRYGADTNYDEYGIFFIGCSIILCSVVGAVVAIVSKMLNKKR